MGKGYLGNGLGWRYGHILIVVCTPSFTGQRLSVEEDSKIHTILSEQAAAVPVHWEEKVLERDVRLRVLEKVPIGTPDTLHSTQMILILRPSSRLGDTAT